MLQNDCSFSNKDEIVKVLFLMNQCSRWRHYLSSYSRMLELNTTTEVHAVQKCYLSRNKCFHSNSRSTSGWKSSSWDKGGKKCGNCGHSHLPKQCPAYSRECFKCKKKNHFSTPCQSSEKKPGSGISNPTCFCGV